MQFGETLPKDLRVHLVFIQQDGGKMADSKPVGAETLFYRNHIALEGSTPAGTKVMESVDSMDALKILVRNFRNSYSAQVEMDTIKMQHALDDERKLYATRRAARSPIQISWQDLTPEQRNAVLNSDIKLRIALDTEEARLKTTAASSKNQ